MNSCNIGYSDTMENAIMRAIRRRGKVASRTEDPTIRLRLGQWTLHIHPLSDHPRWEPIQYLKRDGGDDLICGQCAACDAVTPDTIRRTTANLPWLEPEEAHLFEDRVMCDVLRLCKNGSPQTVELAAAAFDMATQRRTRWYA